MADILFAPFTANTLGDNVVIAGSPTATTIQVVAIFFQCGTATTIIARAGSTALTGTMTFSTGGGFQLPNNGQVPYFTCSNGDDFIIHLSGLTGTCGGFVMYYQF